MKKVLVALLVAIGFSLHAPEGEFFHDDDQEVPTAGKRRSDEDPQVRSMEERLESSDSEEDTGAAVLKKKKRRVQWVPDGFEPGSDTELDDTVVMDVEETLSKEEAQKEREEIEKSLKEDQKDFAEQAGKKRPENDEEGYEDVTEIEAEYESLVALNYDHLSTLDAHNVNKAEEISIGKMINYLNIFKGSLAQLPETEDAKELEERIAFKATVLLRRKNLIKLQEGVEKLKRLRDEKGAQEVPIAS